MSQHRGKARLQLFPQVVFDESLASFRSGIRRKMQLDLAHANDETGTPFDHWQDTQLVLESLSKPLMERVEYKMDDRLRMTVTNDTVDFYRYIDCTELTRITIDFIREKIETELPANSAI